ncbi:unnamed protein product, partial [Mesorhabditis belari]|uniref:Hikeshi-like domain-containing protein n=1 Tax=Mesorhabditis belari TaxID=2138241 RepID=A0AAF3FBT7_9BILA
MAQNVFGVVVGGRMLQTDFVQAGEREFMIEIPDADSINHVVIFLTGVQPFPDGTAGAVYMRWPLPSGNESNWHFLGYISNEKPSSIFKVAKLHRADAQHTGIFGSSFSASAHGTAQLGIQLDVLSEIQSRVPDGVTEPTTQSTLAEFANKMLQNLVNHAQSFTVRLPRPDGLGTNEYIPLNALQDWFNTFSRRFQQNPYFWKGLNNG